jgi:hypothetical protein
MVSIEWRLDGVKKHLEMGNLRCIGKCLFGDLGAATGRRSPGRPSADFGGTCMK